MPNKSDNLSFDVGVAQTDITPQAPILLTGFAARAKSETTTVLNRLSAKAIAFGSDEQERTVLIIAEIIGIKYGVTAKVVEAISKRTGINPAQIAISVTHTHGSPEVGNLLNILQCRGNYPSEHYFNPSLLAIDELIHIAEFNEFLTKKLVDVAIAALHNRKPALVSWGKGQASFAVNRRTDGGVVDHSLPVLRVTDLDGRLRAVLVNYACHGIALGPDLNEIHGDWMGEAQKIIEEMHPGTIAFVFIGCAGESHPKLQGKREYISLYGQEIADNVDKLLKSELHPISSSPTATMKWIKLPFSKLPDISELIKQTKDNGIKGYCSRLALERVLRGDSIAAELDYPIQVWDFGGKLTMLNMGGEVMVDYSIRLKRELGKELWINSYSNDVSCYVPSRRILKEGGYEAEASMYWYNNPVPFANEVEDIIVNTVHEIIDN
jgi:hypothetical protein